MGDLWIQHVGTAQPKSVGYVRKLDLATGVVSVTQPLSDGSVISEEVISSAVDHCIAIRLRSTAPEGLNFDVRLTHPLKTAASTTVRDADTFLMQGQAQYDRGDKKNHQQFDPTHRCSEACLVNDIHRFDHIKKGGRRYTRVDLLVSRL